MDLTVGKIRFVPQRVKLSAKPQRKYLESHTADTEWILSHQRRNQRLICLINRFQDHTSFFSISAIPLKVIKIFHGIGTDTEHLVPLQFSTTDVSSQFFLLIVQAPKFMSFIFIDKNQNAFTIILITLSQLFSWTLTHVLNVRQRGRIRAVLITLGKLLCHPPLTCCGK